MKKYSMSDIYWAEECVDNTIEREEIFIKSNESKDELQFYFADEVDEELRTTKRALWLARARSARESWNMWRVRYHYNPIPALQELTKAIMDKWETVERKCRAKAEEYR